MTLAEELGLMAEDEIERACSIPWCDLVKVTPWGDTYDGFAPSGRPVMVERSYIFATEPGGDVLVEVTVFQNAVLYEEGERRRRVVKAPPGALAASG